MELGEGAFQPLQISEDWTNGIGVPRTLPLEVGRSLETLKHCSGTLHGYIHPRGCHPLKVKNIPLNGTPAEKKLLVANFGAT